MCSLIYIYICMLFVICWGTILSAAYANNYRKIKGKQNYFRTISRIKTCVQDPQTSNNNFLHRKQKFLASV